MQLPSKTACIATVRSPCGASLLGWTRRLTGSAPLGRGRGAPYPGRLMHSKHPLSYETTELMFCIESMHTRNLHGRCFALRACTREICTARFKFSHLFGWPRCDVCRRKASLLRLTPAGNTCVPIRSRENERAHTRRKFSTLCVFRQHCTALARATASAEPSILKNWLQGA